MQTRKVQCNERHAAPSSSRPAHHWLCVALGYSLLAGLSGCGPAQPDPIGRAAPDPRSSATITATPSHLGRPFNINPNASLQPAPPSAPERHTTGARPQTQAAPDAVRSALADIDPTTAVRQQWFAEARVHPEVSVRLQALELWAEQPSQDLDPLTYALVDEDETVRTRAQELYEQQLAREAASAAPSEQDGHEQPGKYQ